MLRHHTTEALFAELFRFGVTGGEQFFRNLAESNFPDQIAALWRKHFNSSPAFAQFADAAAEELWARLIGPSPTAIANGVACLFDKMHDLLEGRCRATPEDAFGYIEELMVSDLSGVSEDLLARFRTCAHEHLRRLIPDMPSLFESIPEQLVIYGRGDLADRLIKIQRYFAPNRTMLSEAGVLTARGNHKAAVQHLLDLAAETTKSVGHSDSLVRRLISLGALEEAQQQAAIFVRIAERTGDRRTAAALRRLMPNQLSDDGALQAVSRPYWSTNPGHAPSQGATWKWVRGWSASAENVLSFFNVVHPPVDVESLITRLGVRILVSRLDGCYGRTEFSSDSETAIFWLNSRDSYPRKRFTMAFLLGCLLLNSRDRTYQRTDHTNSKNQDDKRALDFASALLMPRSILEPLVDADGPKLNVRSLARMFRVSTNAMKFTLGERQRHVDHVR
jgi:IrrE N-terminal-like domain